MQLNVTFASVLLIILLFPGSIDHCIVCHPIKCFIIEEIKETWHFKFSCNEQNNFSATTVQEFSSIAKLAMPFIWLLYVVVLLQLSLLNMILNIPTLICIHANLRSTLLGALSYKLDRLYIHYPQQCMVFRTVFQNNCHPYHSNTRAFAW